MTRPRFLHRLTYALGMLAVLLALCLSSGGASAYAAHTAPARYKFTPDSILTARPLWKYAQRLKTTGPRAAIPPCLTNGLPPRCFSPAQIREAYGVQPLINAGITGKGRTILLVEGGTSTTLNDDVHLYDQLYGLKDPTINVISPFGPVPIDPGWYVETALDVEIAHAIAPDATIDLVLAQTTFSITPTQALSTLLGATKYAVDHNLGDVISQSFGAGETCLGGAYVNAEEKVFSAAAAKGISVLASAGDSGAAALTCTSGLPTYTEELGVDLPAADPLVTAVGGTSLDAAVTTGTYGSEIVWNESGAFAGATGGGFSTVFGVPSYQKSITPSLPARGIPDISFVGDPFTGVPIVLSLQGQTLIVPIGGTSVGSPAWAGIVALADQAAGKRLGFLNTALYKLGANSSAYKSACHDITLGNNNYIGFDSKGNTIPIIGYTATAGWDAATGFGTPDVKNLVPLLIKYSA